MPAETALAHAGLTGEPGERKIVGEMPVDPVVQRAKFIFGRLQGKRLAELRLPARTLEEDNEVTRHGQCQGATQVLFHDRQGQIDAGRHSGGGPDRTIAHEDRVGLDPHGGKAPG